MYGTTADLRIDAGADACVEMTLNRPGSRNALSRSLIAALTEAMKRADADDGVHTVILTGAAPAFCAGLDLREVAATSADQAEVDSSALLELFEAIDHMSKPVIAAVNGPAVAGGAGLVSVCDLAICGESAAVGYPEIKRGLVAAIVMTYLRRLVGERQSKYLLLTGETLDARRSLALGLVNEVVADADLLPRARHYAALLAKMPPQAIANTKALLAKIRGLDHDQAVRQARELNASMRLTSESRAGVKAFLADSNSPQP